MKIHILADLKKGPWGGGNQFLKALRKEWRARGWYSEKAKEAEVILFNSYPFGNEKLFDFLKNLKKESPTKIVVCRLDGPISFVRGADREIDNIISIFNQLLADGIIFQSQWCQKQNREHFGLKAPYQTQIYNAPDPKIFNRKGKRKFDPKKVKLIAVSWSPNWRKGFGVYQFLDQNLDFSRYSMTFVGNSPVKFQNIDHIPPVSSPEVAKLLKQHDIYITASQNDPCSNSLIEALSCGLPAVVLNDGGHPELIGKGGVTFESKKDVLKQINKVVENYRFYQSNLPNFSLAEVARAYYQFARQIYLEAKKGKYQPKRVDAKVERAFLKMKLMILQWKLKTKLKFLYERLRVGF